ncbi:MAG: hypothetical protein H6659_03755 [Ardenticatenaceae bacterium]|nr:hypothetical protein [Ardenticatenaceae bacterium]MCB8986375.1 hypothetical protein [Ardenticatenaceae bacterium]
MAAFLDEATWGRPSALANCPQCDGVFLLPESGETAVPCPFCGQANLTLLGAESVPPQAENPPELLVPFSANAAQLPQTLARFAQSTRFAPADLTPQNLHGRLRPLFLPMWLIDADAQAQWQAEAGFDYQVVSHREQFHNGQWRTQKIEETKIRWEPRLGTLQRRYENETAPALEQHAQLEQTLGKFRRQEAVAYQPQALGKAIVRLPNRPTADAWPEAQEAIKSRAAEECRQAAAADHIRQFRWSVQFAGQNWTQLLLPLYTTYYRDDEGAVRRVFIHGQTGSLRGERRASMKKARRWALGIAVIAAVLFVLSLVLAAAGYFQPDVLLPALITFVLALGVGITAVLPLLLAWLMNRQQKSLPIT